MPSRIFLCFFLMGCEPLQKFRTLPPSSCWKAVQSSILEEQGIHNESMKYGYKYEDFAKIRIHIETWNGFPMPMEEEQC
ncbi:hypothetical protein CM49_02896 [Paenibacillus sp. P1XP2]|nr:hypothetical protein CM49_02896 [Paenibacillus sp. P1XP2]